MDYGRFLSATLVAPQPADNTTTKGIAVKLDKEGKAGIIFDTMMMRYSAGWSGGFLSLHGVAFDGAHGVNPSVDGEQKFGTHPGPGWADKAGSLKDPRNPKTDPYGPMPREWLHVQGAVPRRRPGHLQLQRQRHRRAGHAGRGGEAVEPARFTRTLKSGLERRDGA